MWSFHSVVISLVYGFERLQPANQRNIPVDRYPVSRHYLQYLVITRSCFVLWQWCARKKNWKSLPYCPRKGQRFFRFSNRPDRLWGLPSLLLSVFRGPFPIVMRPGRNLNHSPLSSAVTNEWNYTSAPPTCPHGVNKYNFTFFYLHYWIPLPSVLAISCSFETKKANTEAPKIPAHTMEFPLLFDQGCEICNLQH